MRGGRLEEDDRRQRRVKKNSRCAGEKVAGSTSPLIKGKEEERERCALHTHCIRPAR